MENFRNLRVIKKPRLKPLLDIPINFQPLKNLHLELLEVKEKLKKGLPLIPISKPIIKKEESEEDEVEEQPGPINKPPTPAQKEDEERAPKLKKRGKDRDKEREFEKHKKKHANSKEKPSKKSKSKGKKEIIVEELGESSSEQTKSGTQSEAPTGTTEGSSASSSSSKESSSESSNSKGSDTDAGSTSASSAEKVEDKEEEYDPYAGLSPEEREIKEKEEYIWRFRILKKQYGRNTSIPIPEWNEHSDLAVMKSSYERTIKELYLDDAVETYRTYLLGGWMAIEYCCTQLMSIDLRGFTLQQTKMMHKYDRMLIELGEKSYTRWGMNLPVEIRLMGLILFQAAIFYLGKVIAEKHGSGVAEMFRGFTGQPPGQHPPAQHGVPQGHPPAPHAQTHFGGTPQGAADNGAQPRTTAGTRMRGPKISAADIRNNKPHVSDGGGDE